jgi:hypothetical protein
MAGNRQGWLDALSEQLVERKRLLTWHADYCHETQRILTQRAQKQTWYSDLLTAVRDAEERDSETYARKWHLKRQRDEEAVMEEKSKRMRLDV